MTDLHNEIVQMTGLHNKIVQFTREKVEKSVFLILLFICRHLCLYHVGLLLVFLFGTTQILLPDRAKLKRWSYIYHSLRFRHEWLDVFMIRSDFECFLYRALMWSQFWDSVLQL